MPIRQSIGQGLMLSNKVAHPSKHLDPGCYGARHVSSREDINYTGEVVVEDWRAHDLGV